MTQKQTTLPRQKATRQTVSDQVLREFTGYSIRRTASIIHADINRSLKHLGLRMISFSVLTMVSRNPSIRQANLAEALAMERPNLVSIVSELQKVGWITRIPDPHDRRAYGLKITAIGRNVLAKATAAASAHEAKVTKDLDQDERKILVRALKKIEDTSRNGR